MKWIGRIFIVLIVIVVLALVGLYVMLDTIATNAVAKAGTHATGVETTVDSVHIGVFAGEVTIDDLKIANPEGFPSDRFMSLGEGELNVGLASLMSDTVNVGLIRLDNIVMNLEDKDGKANYEVIMDNLSKLSDPDAPKSPEPEEDGAASKKFIVREILITNVNVNATYGGKKIPVSIPEIKLTDVGSGEGAKQVTMSEIMGIVIGATFETLLKNPDLLPAAMVGTIREGVAGLGDLGDFSVENIGEITQGVGEIIKTVPGGEKIGSEVDALSGEATQKIEEGIGDLGGEADKVTEKLEGLGGLLGGKKDEAKTEEPANQE